MRNRAWAPHAAGAEGDAALTTSGAGHRGMGIGEGAAMSKQSTVMVGKMYGVRSGFENSTGSGDAGTTCHFGQWDRGDGHPPW